MNHLSRLVSITKRLLGPIDLRSPQGAHARQALYNRLYEKYREFTMQPMHRFLNNLQLVDRYRPAGCVVECGVWRGGAIAAIAELLGPQRTYLLFDSFEGLPPAGELDG